MNANRRPGGSANGVLRFLLVSSDRRVLGPFKRAIRLASGRVTCVNDALSGLECALRDRFDAVIVDLGVQDATAFIISLHTSCPGRFTVLFGCTSSAQQRADALKAGASYALPKPLNVDVAFQAISLVLRPRELDSDFTTAPHR